MLKKIIKSISLEFPDPTLEQAFKQEQIKNYLNYMRFSILIGALIYISFTLLDQIITPDVAYTARLTRIIVISIIFFPIFISTFFKKFHQYIYIFLVIIIISTAASIIFIMYISHSNYAHLHFAGIILVFFYSYTFSHLLFKFVNISSIVIWTIYTIYAIGKFNTNHVLFLIDTSFLLGSFIASVYAGYSLEQFSRLNFIALKELKEEKDKLKLASFIDYLTKLYNRRYMEIRLKEAINLYQREKIPISILFIDLDNFKIINDNYGHDFGDIVLKQIAITMNTVLRDKDIVFRYGGDEFCILLFNTDLNQSLQIGRRILNQLKNIKYINQHPVTLSFSGGGLTLNPKIKTVNDIIKKADNLLYKAKKQGKATLLTENL
ncbi:diguanylate cyclase (GGDEF) domain-containing protein [Desulfonauticus submarinus]|uniref:diguanylate cyclase n=1 Tax=Desulfonauticus submarinus TaxID=206665 RepID=A0A1H0ADU1_9BACT|nr:GGDEF domain-containing protein [Desulfonauticus submarinus]SDN30886.1 diguanylate cyclase (GGDEF) domain-containing protein [Desulfonauticus submarinus]